MQIFLFGDNWHEMAYSGLFSDKKPQTIIIMSPAELDNVVVKAKYHYCFLQHITKTRLYNFDPLKPHFYIVKLGFTGVYIIFLVSAQKHSL